MDNTKNNDKKAESNKGQKEPAKKQWKKPELNELNIDKTAGGPVQNPVDNGSRNPS